MRIEKEKELDVELHFGSYLHQAHSNSQFAFFFNPQNFNLSYPPPATES
jgi:hypothetical protein